MPIIITVKVKPSSRKQMFILDSQGNIVCWLKSPPVDGKANHELVKLLSSLLDIPQRAISIIQGLSQRTKRIEINDNITQEILFERLGLALQQRLDHKG